MWFLSSNPSTWWRGRLQRDLHALPGACHPADAPANERAQTIRSLKKNSLASLRGLLTGHPFAYVVPLLLLAACALCLVLAALGYARTEAWAKGEARAACAHVADSLAGVLGAAHACAAAADHAAQLGNSVDPSGVAGAFFQAAPLALSAAQPFLVVLPPLPPASNATTLLSAALAGVVQPPGAVPASFAFWLPDVLGASGAPVYLPMRAYQGMDTLAAAAAYAGRALTAVVGVPLGAVLTGGPAHALLTRQGISMRAAVAGTHYEHVDSGFDAARSVRCALAGAGALQVWLSWRVQPALRLFVPLAALLGLLAAVAPCMLFVALVRRSMQSSLLADYLPHNLLDKVLAGDLVRVFYSNANILFADIVSYSSLSQRVPIEQLTDILDELFTHFDQTARDLGVYKSDIIGDAFMAMTNCPNVEAQSTALLRLLDFALRMIDITKELNSVRKGGPDIQIRIGINTGDVVGCVLGITSPRFSPFGEAVNLASRMESHGVAGEVHISQRVKDAIDRYLPGRFIVAPHPNNAELVVKGYGPMHTYLVKGFALARHVKSMARCRNVVYGVIDARNKNFSIISSRLGLATPTPHSGRPSTSLDLPSDSRPASMLQHPLMLQHHLSMRRQPGPRSPAAIASNLLMPSNELQLTQTQSIDAPHELTSNPSIATTAATYV